jgi:hypothetical protein
MSRRAVTLLITALGLLLLARAVQKTGLDHITDGIRSIGITGLLAILATGVARQVLRSAAWVLLMKDHARVPLGRALAATIAGDAIRNLTPLSLAASEPAKAMLVRAHMPPQRALAAHAAENFFYSLSVALAVLAGVAVFFLEFTVPESLRALSLLLVAAMAAVLVGGLWLVWKRPALVSSTLGGLTRFTGARAPAYIRFIEKIRALETSSYAFVRAKPGRLAGVAVCEAGFHVMSVAEAWCVLYFLGAASIPRAIVFDTVQRMINVIFKVVPLKVGVDEYFSGLMSQALGLGSALGVTMGVIRKIRVLFWSLVGLVLLR